MTDGAAHWLINLFMITITRRARPSLAPRRDDVDAVVGARASRPVGGFPRARLVAPPRRAARRRRARRRRRRLRRRVVVVVVVVAARGPSESRCRENPPSTPPGVVVGSALVPGFDGVEVEHAKLEVRQGRVFVTLRREERGDVSWEGAGCFRAWSYAVPEGATIALGEEGAAFEVEQRDGGGAGTGGVDAMSQMMALQFEATASAEVKEALRGGE